MKFLKKLFGKKETPHQEYLRLKLDLEGFTLLFGIEDLRIIGDIELDQVVGEAKRKRVRNKQDRMMELYHFLKDQDKDFQDDIFEELRNKII